MKKSFALGAVLCLSLAGCSAATPPAPNAPNVKAIESGSTDSPASSPSSSTPPPMKSDRGGLIKVVGQPASMTNADNQPIVEFVITKIDTKPKCDGPYPEKSQNGTLIALKMDVQTYKEMNSEEGISSFDAGSYGWKYISPEGTTFNGELGGIGAFSCMKESKTLPGNIGPAEKVTGWIVLDVPKADGTLILDPNWNGGWEWEIAPEKPNA